MGLGNLRFAVLGLVAVRPNGVHGYQLKNELDAVCGGFWAVNYGSVYRVLDILDEAGDLTGSTEATAEGTALVMDGVEMRVKADLAWLDHVSRWITTRTQT
jgi:DNA-binding PadR family transcriptional regulator